MRYLLTTRIQAPRGHVAACLRDAARWSQWQESLISHRLTAGRANEVGAKTQMVHQFGRRRTEMIETIESNRLPEELTATYEAPRVWNRVVHRFIEVSPKETEWQFDSEFICTGLVRMLATVAPGLFRKSSKQSMDAFKQFVETNSAAMEG